MVYRVEMKDADGATRRTAPARVQASTSCPIRMSDEETRMSKNLILGLTAAGQPVVPAGFSSMGIVARISPEGDLQTLPPGSAEYSRCQRRLAGRLADRAVACLRRLRHADDRWHVDGDGGRMRHRVRPTASCFSVRPTAGGKVARARRKR